MYNIYSLALHFLLSLLISPSAPLSLASPSFPSSVFLSFFICFLHLLPGSPIFFYVSSSLSLFLSIPSLQLFPQSLLLPQFTSFSPLVLLLLLFPSFLSSFLLLTPFPFFSPSFSPFLLPLLFFFLSFILILSPSLAFFSLSSFFRLYPPSPLGSNWSVQ